MCQRSSLEFFSGPLLFPRPATRWITPLTLGTFFQALPGPQRKDENNVRWDYRREDPCIDLELGFTATKTPH